MSIPLICRTATPQAAAVSDAEVEAYYKAHTADFVAPEQAKIEYLVLDPAALQAQIKIDPTVLQGTYDRDKARALKQEIETVVEWLGERYGDDPGFVRRFFSFVNSHKRVRMLPG